MHTEKEVLDMWRALPDSGLTEGANTARDIARKSSKTEGYAVLLQVMSERILELKAKIEELEAQQ